MAAYEDGKWDIVPGISIGDFKLGIKLDELKKNIDFNYEVQEDFTYGILILKNEMIEFTTKLENGEYRLTQIAVKGDFPGKFLNKIGIGTILSDYKESLEYTVDEEMLSNYHSYYFISTKYLGITFITEKPWDENTKIVRITVENVI